jgi:hypothetical protein
MGVGAIRDVSNYYILFHLYTDAISFMHQIYPFRDDLHAFICPFLPVVLPDQQHLMIAGKQFDSRLGHGDLCGYVSNLAWT